uniref:Uncharacterized protein n=1 Tax=Timema douglasi TaxID=61478 RepID=A0A7R8VD35_TIMDO|nr:unnamed protein product [Timema douglasi]
MDSEGEDYMPEWTGENLALLNSAGDQDSDKDEEERDESNNFAEELTLNTENGDSTGTQLSLGADVGMMPSHDSIDGLDVSEFEISAPTSLLPDTGRLERQLDPDASDTDDEDIAGIQFQSSHFNGDSSEEEEKAFTQGLTFTDNQQNVDNQAAGKAKIDTVAGSTSLGEMLKSTVVQAVTKNITDLGVMGQSLFSTVMNSGVSRATTPAKKSTNVEDILSSDDDSDDFEIISQDDLS